MRNTRLELDRLHERRDRLGIPASHFLIRQRHQTPPCLGARGIDLCVAKIILCGAFVFAGYQIQPSGCQSYGQRIRIQPLRSCKRSTSPHQPCVVGAPPPCEVVRLGQTGARQHGAGIERDGPIECGDRRVGGRRARLRAALPSANAG